MSRHFKEVLPKQQLENTATIGFGFPTFRKTLPGVASFAPARLADNAAFDTEQSTSLLVRPEVDTRRSNVMT